MRVEINLMKPSTEIIDLSKTINPRVGDDDLLLPLHIVYGDNQTDMRGKDVEFLSNDTNKKRIYIAGTCNTDTPGDNLYMGNLTFRFPAGTFKADGTYDPDKTMFRIVDKATNKVISSVNVKITVMKNGIEFDFDPDKSSYDSRAETMLQDFHDKGQAMLDDIKNLNDQAKSNVSGDTAATAQEAKKQADTNAGDISGLKGEIAGARGRFADLPGREDAQDTAINQKESVANANANYAALKQKDAQQDAAINQKAGKFELENRLAQLDLQPDTFGSLEALQKKYPNGEAGIAMVNDATGLYTYYYDANAKAWNKGAKILDKVDLDDVTTSYDNYIANPAFTNGPLVSTAESFSDGEEATTAVVKQGDGNWSHLEATKTSWGVGVFLRMDPDKVKGSSFQWTEKLLSLKLTSSPTIGMRKFQIEFWDTDADTANTTKQTLATFWVEPGKLYEINYQFALPRTTYTNHTYQVLISDINAEGVQNDANGGGANFSIKEPYLRDVFISAFNSKGELVSTGTTPESDDLAISNAVLANEHTYHITGTNAQNKDFALKLPLRIPDITFDDAHGVKLKAKLHNNTNMTHHFRYEFWLMNYNDVFYKKNLGEDYILPFSWLKISKKCLLDQLDKPVKQNYGFLVIIDENTTEANYDIGKGLSLRIEYGRSKPGNLFGDYILSSYVSGADTNTTTYGGQEALHVSLSKSVDYSIVFLPFRVDEPGIYDFDLAIVGNDDGNKEIQAQLNSYNADTSTKSYHVLRNIKLVKGKLTHYRFTYHISQDDASQAYQALVLCTHKDSANFIIASAKATPHVQADLYPAEHNLPEFNLLADLDETNGALTKGMVEINNGGIKEIHYATFKIQGDSSKEFPKKSWRINFYSDASYSKKEDVAIFPDYPAVNSLNMKANYIDWTQANNILVSRYIADLSIVTDIDHNQAGAPMACQITGEPVIGYNNGQLLGLFAISPKKSNTLFAMNKKSKAQAAFESTGLTAASRFSDDVATFGEGKAYTIEAPDDDVEQPLKDSFNALLKFVHSSTDEEFKTGIASKVNLQSIANWLITATLFGLSDNLGKNICFATWDGGKTWSVVDYDHDLAMGINWNGTVLTHADDDFTLEDMKSKHVLLWRCLHLHVFDDMLVDTYQEFVQTHPVNQVINDFRQYYYHIGPTLYREDQALWPDEPGTNYFNGYHSASYLRRRYKLCNVWFTKNYLATL